METNNNDTIHKLSEHFVHLFVLVAAALTLGAVLFIMIDFPPKQAQAVVFYGGRVITYVPPTTIPACPGHIVINNIGGIVRGRIGLTLPPRDSRESYNYYTPRNWVIGRAAPVPIVTCTLPYPVFLNDLTGSSLRPSN